MLHDVLIVMAFYAKTFNVTVNNPFIAGILTVVGYSINDTIVVFDRIRENLQAPQTRHAAGSCSSIRSITQTLGRSLMTSVTTLIVMVPMLIMSQELRSVNSYVPLMVGVHRRSIFLHRDVQSAVL